MVFVCVIWSFDDMGLGKQVILSDKKSKGGQWAMNILNNQPVSKPSADIPDEPEPVHPDGPLSLFLLLPDP